LIIYFSLSLGRFNPIESKKSIDQSKNMKILKISESQLGQAELINPSYLIELQ